MSLGGGTGSNVGAERIFGGMTTLHYFTVLGTRPHIGRLFASSDSEEPGAAPMTALTTRSGSVASTAIPALSANVDAEGRPYTVIGVTPEGFHGTSVVTADLWVPISMVGDLRHAPVAPAEPGERVVGDGCAS